MKHDLGLSDRIYHRDICGMIIDIDYNASRKIRKSVWIKVGPVQPESTPVEIATSAMHGIYPYRQMSVAESGSPMR
jgi:hypothetical protein